ncbi:unnamed protein product, partial [Musa textilis]
MSQAKKKLPKKKKALKVTWDDSSSSEDEEASNKEEANFALMALGDEVSELFNEDLSFNELLNAFHELFDECKSISKKFNLLKEHALLQDKLGSLQTPSLPPFSKC